MKITCAVSGKEFRVSDLEIELRAKFGLDGLPQVSPKYRFRELGAFWQHWNLYKRKCDKTGRDIISVFRPDCEYPVWHKDEWVAHANPPGADVDFSKEIFPQMWDFFQKSPIPHRTGNANENCEYTDDCWHSKNVYMAHSLAHCEDIVHSYRVVKCKDLYYCAFSSGCEVCVDVVNSDGCFQLVHSLNCRNCRDSAFLYDCRNCNDCMFCSNLRNKQYCFGNQQLSKSDFERKKAEWDLRSRAVYEGAKKYFYQMMVSKAYHRALSNDLCENVTGNYNSGSKDCENCYFTNDNEQAVNSFRTYVGKTLLDVHGQTCEMCFNTILAQDECYEIRCCSQISVSRYMQYCAFCLNCQYCFGCCGLVGKKYHIFNKPYSEEEYHEKVKKLVDHMKSTGEYGRFFPGYFAQHPYDESWSSFYFPLSPEEQVAAGFRWKPPVERRKKTDLDSSEVPDRCDADVDLTKSYWDEEYDRPFRIRESDVSFSKRLGVPLPYTYYIYRIQKNFEMLPFDGELRDVECCDCGKMVATGWSNEFDGRILCEEDYLKVVK